MYKNIYNDRSIATLETIKSNRINVKIYKKERIKELPKYETTGSAGIDLKPFIDGTESIEPGETKLIPTGLFLEIPEGFEIQIRSRSGLALRSGIVVKNSPGTIDSDYRGEIKVMLYNTSNTPYFYDNNTRIAQAVLSPIFQIQWDKIEKFSDLEHSERGSGGFGSTGV